MEGKGARGFAYAALSLSGVAAICLGVLTPFILSSCNQMAADIESDIRNFKEAEVRIWEGIQALSDHKSRRLRRQLGSYASILAPPNLVRTRSQAFQPVYRPSERPDPTYLLRNSRPHLYRRRPTSRVHPAAAVVQRILEQSKTVRPSPVFPTPPPLPLQILPERRNESPTFEVCNLGPPPAIPPSSSGEVEKDMSMLKTAAGSEMTAPLDHRGPRGGRETTVPTSPRVSLSLFTRSHFSGEPGRQGLHGQPGFDGEHVRVGESGGCTTCPAGRRGWPGEPGPLGPQGRPGGVGDPGRSGLPGGRGRPGLLGDKGPKGYPGRSGLDSDAVVYTKGRPGAKGLTGRTGDRGDAGRSGRDGFRGARGDFGPIGPDGRPGRPGESRQGPRGQAGLSAPFVAREDRRCWICPPRRDVPFSTSSYEITLPPPIIGNPLGGPELKVGSPPPIHETRVPDGSIPSTEFAEFTDAPGYPSSNPGFETPNRGNQPSPDPDEDLVIGSSYPSFRPSPASSDVPSLPRGPYEPITDGGPDILEPEYNGAFEAPRRRTIRKRVDALPRYGNPPPAPSPQWAPSPSTKAPQPPAAIQPPPEPWPPETTDPRQPTRETVYGNQNPPEPPPQWQPENPDEPPADPATSYWSEERQTPPPLGYGAQNAPPRPPPSPLW